QLIPDVVPDRTEQEHAEIKLLVSQAQVQAVGEIRIWIAQESAVVRSHLAVSGHIRIPEAPHTHIGLVFAAGRRAIGCIYLFLLIPEAFNPVTEKLSDGMAYRVADYACSVEPPAFLIKVIGAAGNLDDLVVHRGESKRGVQREVFGNVHVGG